MNIDEQISVIAIFKRNGKILPWRISWQGRVYKAVGVDFHHFDRSGSNLCHILGVSTDSLYFRLRFNSEKLTWIAEEVVDVE